MERAKYIVVWDDDEEYPVVFPEHLNHATVAAKLTMQMAGEFQKHVRSAGFVEFYVVCPGQVGVECYGKSVSLGIGSREQDGDVLERWLGLRG